MPTSRTSRSFGYARSSRGKLGSGGVDRALPAAPNACKGAAQGCARVPSFQRLRINHYRTKSRADYEAKMGKGVVEADESKWRKQPLALVDRNEVEDTAILAYLPRLRAELASLV